MFKRKRKRDLKVPVRLSSEEKKQIKKVVDNAKKADKVPHSAQESITFERMFPSGICREEGDFYSTFITENLPVGASTNYSALLPTSQEQT